LQKLRHGRRKTVSQVQGATASADKDAGTVGLTGPDIATVQKAADAMVAAGYFGKSSDSRIKINDNTGAKGKKVHSLQVNGVHLCCGKCVASVDEAVKSVSGVKAHTAVNGAKSFGDRRLQRQGRLFRAPESRTLRAKPEVIRPIEENARANALAAGVLHLRRTGCVSDKPRRLAPERQRR
jgi:hypothetical protein